MAEQAGRRAGKRCQVFGRPAVPVFRKDLCSGGYLTLACVSQQSSSFVRFVFFSHCSHNARDLLRPRPDSKCFINLSFRGESRGGAPLLGLAYVSRTAANGPPCIPGEDVPGSERLIYQPK